MRSRVPVAVFAALLGFAAAQPAPAPELSPEIEALIAPPDIKFGEAASSGSRPNVVFIVADDLGYADIGPYLARALDGSSYTPNLDRLAREGLLFNDAYSNSPVCSPSRFALISGRYQYRYPGGSQEPIAASEEEGVPLGFPTDEPSVPKYLSEAGYRTGLVGKWHLGWPPTFGPLKTGYTDFFGIYAGASDYFLYDLIDGDEPATETGYLTDVLTQRAVEFLEDAAPAALNGTEPFYLSLHFTSPHWPWSTRDDYAHSVEINGSLADNESGSVATYRRMIEQLDEGIGRVLDTLDDLGLADDTIVYFTSDNGGERFSDNWPHVGGKMDLTEGGIRVPWIVRWPSVIAEGSVSGQNAYGIDFVTSILDAAGVTVNESYPLDGVSLLSVFEAPNATFERPLFWRMFFNEQQAFRRGDWKYLKINENEYFFNVTADSRERANKAKKYPELLDTYRAAYEAWAETVPPIPDFATYSLVSSEEDFPFPPK